VREVLCLTPGDGVEFAFGPDGQIVVHKADEPPKGKAPDGWQDRFEAARGKAQVKWRTDELMALLRGEG
jgi:bifunctional DNA-binding transcriptional regulator/antitoxin component of YhaV-PrlF toxin-antitoxin module